MSNLDNLQQINTNIPRETLAFSADGLIIKRPNTKNKDWAKIWLDKQYHARTVIDHLLENKPDSYSIPKMLEISENEFFVVEERAKGQPLTSAYFETLDKTDKDVIYKSLAKFLNDINQSSAVLTQKQMLDSEGGITFEYVVKKLEGRLNSKDLNAVNQSKDWFDKVNDFDASVVMTQGDMNEHNIFYDKETKTLSMIDFADAKYQSVYYMFNADLARLGWLDIERIIAEYGKLDKKQPVRISNIPEIFTMRNYLKNFKNAAVEFINSPEKSSKINAARLAIVKEIITDMSKKYSEIKSKKMNTVALGLLNDTYKKSKQNININIDKEKKAVVL